MASSAELRRKLQWRPLVRSLHRDMGYLAVGLTFVYALSGLAVNHIPDWDPNYQSFRKTHELRMELPADNTAAARLITEKLGVRSPVRSVYRPVPDQLEIQLANGAIHANPLTGHVVEEGQKPRFFLRAANWLHLNRGKKAWRLFADAYAAGLLLLAISGMFMLPGKNGMRGRGALLVGIGVALPVLYLVLAGHP
jgi:hypothetical protein